MCRLAPRQNHRRRQVTAGLGAIAVLLQLLMPLAAAAIGDRSVAARIELPTDYICSADGWLLPHPPTGGPAMPAGAACEFCMVFQFAVFGHVTPPELARSDLLFTETRIRWTGPDIRAATPGTGIYARPVRAPPSLI